MWSEKNVAEVRRLIGALADGDEVKLGEFGDAGRTTDADEQADILRHIDLPPAATK